MSNGQSYDMDDAVSAMEALHASLTDDLEGLEAQILALGHPTIFTPPPGDQTLIEHFEARTALHSGLASIAEVLAWIQWKVEEEPEGDVAVAVEALPKLRGCSIH